MSTLKKISTISTVFLIPVAGWLGIRKWKGTEEVRKPEAPIVEIPVSLEHRTERRVSGEELRNVRARLELKLDELFDRLSIVEGTIDQVSCEGPALDRFLDEAQLLLDCKDHLPLESTQMYVPDAPVTMTFLTQRLHGYSMKSWNTVDDISHLDYQLEKVQKILTRFRSKPLIPFPIHPDSDINYVISQVRYSLVRRQGLFALELLNGISGFERILCIPFIESLREILELEQDLTILKLFISSKRINRAMKSAMSRDLDGCTSNEVVPAY